MTDIELRQKISKSKVRVVVTYLMSAAYAVAALGLIGWLMALGKTELALGVFSGVASTTATITAFWFGSRGSAADPGNGGGVRTGAEVDAADSTAAEPSEEV